MSNVQEQEDQAVADGLADEPERVTPEVVDVDVSGDRDDDGIAAGAEVLQLPVRLEPSDATTVAGMGLVPLRDELKGLTELAVTLAIADNTPSALKGKPAAVLAVFLTGRELGIPPMTALRNLHVIDGKVTVNPKIRAAMVRREGLGKLWPHQGPRDVACSAIGRDDHDEDCTMCGGTDRVWRLCECGSDRPDNDGDVCTWHAKRADDPFVIYTATYTLAMAQNVKIKADGSTLAGKDNWKNYPDRMLSWRALGYLLDDAFPEIGTGLYSPDELGAVTDEDGEPVIDVSSTEVLTERASRERKERAAAGEPPEPPASPDTLATFQRRIANIKRYEGADIVLGNLWLGRRDKGDPAEKLPKVEDLLYRQCKLASAILDMVEKRIDKGEFGDPKVPAEEASGDAVSPGDDQESGDREGKDVFGDPDPHGVTADQVADGVVVPPEDADPGGAASATDAPDSALQAPVGATDGDDGALPFDPATLPQGTTPGDDLTWANEATHFPGLLDEVAAEVRAIPVEELTAVMKALDLSANGLNEATKRARVTARRIRLRLQRMAGL